MRKNKIIKIISLILCLVCVGMFSGCGKKEEDKSDKNVAIADPNLTIENTEETKEEYIKRDVKEKSYYLGLKNINVETPFNYTGTFALDGTTFNANCTYRQLAEKYTTLKTQSDKPIDPQATVRAMWRELPNTTILMFKNFNNAAIATSATKIDYVEFAIEPNTYLYDIIGQQPKKIENRVSFIDSVIYLFGNPFLIEDAGENRIDVTYTFKNCDVVINFNLSDQTGIFNIKYR